MTKLFAATILLSTLCSAVFAVDGRLNYNLIASETFALAENLAIEDTNCPVNEDSFQTVFIEPNLKRYDYQHILYRNGRPYAGFKNNGGQYSYHQAYSGQWEYSAQVFSNSEVSFQKFRNSRSDLISLGNQTVAKMNDFLYGTTRLYRVFCASHEQEGKDGFGHPYSIRYTTQIAQTPSVKLAKSALKACLDTWFIAPLKRDFCK